ncbi:MAG: hypothetical protein WC325_11505 [Candidatus Bathyarchaeia archaeon]|jgi:GTP-sensing pleiotropic transcriptional regulator CodY
MTMILSMRKKGIYRNIFSKLIEQEQLNGYWVSSMTLAKKCGCARGYMILALRMMESEGLVERKSYPDGGHVFLWRLKQ